MAFGDYPAEYNPKINGPYDPSSYYGRPDTPLGQMKLNVLGSWFGRRDKNPRLPLSRAFWRWQSKQMGIATFFQIIVGEMFFYAIKHDKLKHHRNYKYH
ncbi:AAEL001885-PA [Aedes aegypti]|uniref:AAEL001880-PA n=1 Tax=Aedes aegypti TaxID=7159 RepID=Q17JU6_AEDAE|nr:AAEL001880-PA [Aedes aegypti]EAT46966.1 AAEL001885-PA [Aedes aegypti]